MKIFNSSLAITAVAISLLVPLSNSAEAYHTRSNTFHGGSFYGGSTYRPYSSFGRHQGYYGPTSYGRSTYRPYTHTRTTYANRGQQLGHTHGNQRFHNHNLRVPTRNPRVFFNQSRANFERFQGGPYGRIGVNGFPRDYSAFNNNRYGPTGYYGFSNNNVFNTGGYFNRNNVNRYGNQGYFPGLAASVYSSRNNFNRHAYGASYRY